MRVKQRFDDYLTNERNEYGYRKISENAPNDVKKEYDIFLQEIVNCINTNQPLQK